MRLAPGASGARRDGLDGGWPPLPAAWRRYRLRVQLIGDRLERPAAPAQCVDVRLDVRVELPRPAQAYALGALDGERVSCPLPDDPPFPLRRRGHDVRHELARRGREVDAEVERNEVPAALGGTLEQAGEVEQRSRETIELRDDDPARVPGFDGADGGDQRWPVLERLP